MKKIKSLIGLAALLMFAVLGTQQVVQAAPTQTLTILGANGVQGDVDPYSEYSLDGGVTWHQAYLTGSHPWGFLPGTNSWVNFDPSPFVGLYTTVLYRVKFFAPSTWANPTMLIQMKADNRGIVAFNGVNVATITGQGTVSADLAFTNGLVPGLNTIELTLEDWGGWVGFNYRIDLTLESDQPLSILPASSSPAGVAASSGSVSRTPWEMNRGGSWSHLGFSLPSHGHISAYNNAAVPSVGDAGWGSAPDGEIIGFSERSILPGFCLAAVDYTYFQTFVTVPFDTNVTQFTIEFSGIDDGGRVTIYNSAYPNGIIVPGSYVYLGGTATANLADYVIPGENRVVVTQVDDCPTGNNLRVARVVLNGQAISQTPTNSAPLADAGSAQIVESTGGVTSVTLDGSASSDPDGDTLTYAWLWAGGSATGVDPVMSLSNGNYNITLTVDDNNGETATATTTVTVQDTIAPTISINPIAVVEATSTNGTAVDVNTAIVTSDVCGVSLFTSPAGPYAVGSTLVTVVATDCANNSATATTTITVADSTAPILSVPANVNIEANGLLSTANIGTATATDIFAVTITSDAPATYPLGTTVVTWTATDANGNVSTATQTVTVNDTTAPVLTLPANVNIEANGLLSTANIGTATATDIFTVTVISDAPATYPLGTTVVTWTATDANGNVSTATQTVTVSDTTAPVLTLPANVNIEANGLLSTTNIGTATATDIFAVTVTSDAPATYPLGTTVVSWTATDANGNVSTATQTVTVSDTTAPVLTITLVQIGGGDDDRDEGLFRVLITASDIVDPNPLLIANINGATVVNDQIVELKHDDDSEYEFDDGQLEIKGEVFNLNATATDSSGNVESALFTFIFPDADDSDDKSNDDDESDDDD